MGHLKVDGKLLVITCSDKQLEYYYGMSITLAFLFASAHVQISNSKTKLYNPL